ncbi:MAG: hypothetical protein ACWA6U_18540, partial [Breznakibacter sp.]
ETDFYRQFIDDGSKHVGLFYSIDYNKIQRTCMLDTFDYVKYKQLIQEDKLSQQKREFEKKFAKENGLVVDGTAEFEQFLKRLQTYHKIHSIDTGDVKEIINRIFDYDKIVTTHNTPYTASPAAGATQATQHTAKRYV